MYKNKKIYLCSFSNLDLYPSALRLKKESESFNIFDKILTYNEYNLPHDEKFEKLLREKLVPSRGFGYWCWKPFIILKTLESMSDGDILLYVDVGCHLNKEGINRFYEYLDIVIENGALCFELGHIEKLWTKSDLFNYFNVLNNKNITDTFQMMATSFLLLKNDVNLNIVNRWLQVYYDDFSLADDTPSKINNDATFIEHRHDQSIFSILSKIHNLYTIKSEIDFYGNQYYPIWALRDKKDIYSFIASEVSDSFIDKLVWYIPIRKIRNNVRYELKRYAIYSVKKYFGVLEKDNINIFNIKIIDNYLKNIINKKIEKHIKSNKTVKEIIDYINKYRKDIKILQ